MSDLGFELDGEPWTPPSAVGTRFSVETLMEAYVRTWRVEPLGDRVLVLEHPPPAKTAGGIELMEGSRENHQIGTVLAAGPGLVNESGALVPNPFRHQIGATITFAPYVGQSVKVRIAGVPEELRERVRLLRADDIMLRLT